MMSECGEMESASSPSAMPPPQTKEVIKNGKGMTPFLSPIESSLVISYLFVFN